MKPLNYSLLLAAMLSGCVTTGESEELRFGDPKAQDLNAQSFSTELAGHLRLIIKPEEGSQCDSNDLAIVYVREQNTGKETTLKSSCTKSKKFTMATTKHVLEPGVYDISVDMGFLVDAFGYVGFAPTEPEKLSEADRFRAGASKATVGKNKGVINASQGDKTDWWVFEAQEYSAHSIIVQHAGNKSDLEVTLYRSSGDGIVKKRSIPHNQVVRRPLQGEYYLAVKAQPYTGKLDYTIVIDQAATKSKQVAATEKSKPLTITDYWRTNEGRTEIMLAHGANDGIEKGSSIKIFAVGGGRLLGECLAFDISEQESVCRLDVPVQAGGTITARRTL